MIKQVAFEYGKVFDLESARAVVNHGTKLSWPKLFIRVSTQQYTVSNHHSNQVSTLTVIKCNVAPGPNRKNELCSTPRAEKMQKITINHTTSTTHVTRLSLKRNEGIITSDPTSHLYCTTSAEKKVLHSINSSVSCARIRCVGSPLHSPHFPRPPFVAFFSLASGYTYTQSP